ncbi:MAG: ethylbenzene dehydrogenase [Gammaproteobacteria bacterium]|nr:ethylbenzene dehydrogenase [Gammaproteobacteria bacterium]MBU3989858.1 ethylbenzene dehydrogenase [Gammaproteobacteria bacterium]MBU4006189.1 ethylbenzene dehydrogenase [Gammaproteobacteria bacterium]MBU4022644.1 ethylbenzene dehydrogenase [Gammaproteobacteria bacterium]MBU4097144.1 ethylbenzene dehydrogenase [Gammaproteobacteria bacterium]
MNFVKSSITLAVVATLASSGAFAQEKKEKPKPFKPVTVTAIKAAAAPTLDGVADDAVWKSAPVLNFKAVKGVNFKDNKGDTQGTLQVAYSADMLYMLITYDDPTLSVRRSPYVKKADGSWEKLKDPDDKGGDNNKYYEDKLAVIWNIDDSIFGFNERFSCQAACHGGEPGKPYGNKYTGEEGELGDMWHLKYVRGGVIGQIDDQYLDHTRFDPVKAPGAGRKSDPKLGGGYEDIKLVNGKPEFMNKDAKAANKGGTYWLKTEDKVAFDDSKFKVGDEVASVVIAPFTGDRGDIATGAKWANGKWTIEIARKLVTGSKFDVNFSDLNKGYGFGLGLFDNAQVRHAYTQEPLILKFQK